MEILCANVSDAQEAVGRLVKVPLTQGQFDALVDFTLNLWVGTIDILNIAEGARCRSIQRRCRAVVAMGC
jgi:GH24 family phage-related lysozyme (muramidase)